MTSTKDKINKALGISGRQSIDEMLEDLNVEADDFHKAFDALSAGMQTESDRIDAVAEGMSKTENGGEVAMADMTQSLVQMEDLIMQAKQVFKHIIDGITSTDLIDSDLVSAAAMFLDSIRQNISEFVSIYKAKARYVEKIKTMFLAQEHRKELLALKHKYDLELIAAKKEGENGPPTVDAENMVSFNTDDITKMLDDQEKSKEETEEQNRK